MSRKDDAFWEFKQVIENYIQPLISYNGKLRFMDEAYSGELKKLIALYPRKNVEASRVNIYPCFNNPQFHYRMELKRSHKFPALSVAEFILREMMRTSQFIYSKPDFPKIKYHEHKIDDSQVYRNARFDLAYELGLCMWLGGISVYRLLEKIKHWSKKTYEGKRMPFSFLIDTTNKSKGSEDFIKFLDSNHSAVFTDGMSAGIALDNSGQIVRYFSTVDKRHDAQDKHVPLAPYRFHDFAKLCYSETNEGPAWLGIVYQTNGDIIIFKNKDIVFVQRNGKWMHVDSYRYIDIITKCLTVNDELKESYAKKIYLSILDVSFARAGGCIAIIDKAHIATVKEDLIKRDVLYDLDKKDTKKYEKKRILTRLIDVGHGDENKSFFNLDRKLRQELLSLDGATVIDGTGTILGVGAIVKINGGSDEGGRTAATQQLASFGLAIKISMDGQIQGYQINGSSMDSDKPVFSLL